MAEMPPSSPGRPVSRRLFRQREAGATALAEAPPPASKTARKKMISAAYRQVSEQLGNTPAVCRASYVDPRVVDRFEHGETVAHALRKADETEADRDTQKVLEAAVCQLLSA